MLVEATIFLWITVEKPYLQVYNTCPRRRAKAYSDQKSD